MKLIDDWRQAYRFVSMQCMALAVALQGAWEVMPPPLKDRLPDGWVTGISIALLVLGMVGRLVKQGGSDADENQDVAGGPRGPAGGGSGDLGQGPQRRETSGSDGCQGGGQGQC